MRLKNINLSLFILTGLMFLSFAFFVVAQENKTTTNNVFLDSDQDGLTDAEEKTYGTDPYKLDTDVDGYSDGAEVKSGYNPLKPAPGDKIVASQDQKPSGSVLGQTDISNNTAANSENITQKISQKIVEISNSANPDDQSVSMDEIKSLVGDAINSSSQTDDLPQIKDSDIKTKEQNYKGSESKIKSKKKEDFINYITAVFYIISSNSPHPITSNTDITGVISQVSQEITSAMISRDTSSLNNLNQSGQKILEQLKEVEVPQELVDTHKKALAYAMYSQKLKEYVTPNPEDPLKDIANFSKITAFISNLTQFSTDIQVKFTEYDISYDDTIKNKIKSYGIEPPNVDEAALIKAAADLANTATSTTDTTTDTSTSSLDLLDQ
jgi:hypothetical protein